ncbi:hypothetical protein AAMO2058_000181400 [Amorphochlora amoebiformis]
MAATGVSGSPEGGTLRLSTIGEDIPMVEVMEEEEKEVTKEERAEEASERPMTALSELGSFHKLILAQAIKEYKGGKTEIGLFHGKGSATMKNGDSYNGEFAHGLFHGKGRYLWAKTGVVYDGEWNMCKIQGKGRYDWPDGSWYEGGVLNGLRDGYGIFCRASQIAFCLYEGHFKKGKRHGEGKLYYTENKDSYYDGGWKDGMRHGKGTIKYNSGNVYKGSWISDKKNGYGEMTWATVDQWYKGEWVSDHPSGHGEYTWGRSDANGAASKRVSYKRSVTHYQRNNSYLGSMKYGMRDGQGTFYYATGDVYHGGWKRNMREGKGCLVDENGNVFRGEYKYGRQIPKSKPETPTEHPQPPREETKITKTERHSNKFNTSAHDSTISGKKDPPKSNDTSNLTKPSIDTKHNRNSKQEITRRSKSATLMNRNITNSNRQISRSRSALHSSKKPQANLRTTGSSLSRMSEMLGESEWNDEGEVEIGYAAPDTRFDPQSWELLDSYPACCESEGDKMKEMETVKNLVQSHNSTIRCIYRYYASQPSPSDNMETKIRENAETRFGVTRNSGTLMRLRQLWRLIIDCDIVGPRLSLAMLNRMVAASKTNSEGLRMGRSCGYLIHDPDHTVLLREFVFVLVRTADALRLAGDAQTSTLANQVSALFEQKIFPKAARFAPQVPSLVMTGGHVESRGLLRDLMEIQGRKPTKRKAKEDSNLRDDDNATVPSFSPQTSAIPSERASKHPSSRKNSPTSDLEQSDNQLDMTVGKGNDTKRNSRSFSSGLGQASGRRAIGDASARAVSARRLSVKRLTARTGRKKGRSGAKVKVEKKDHKEAGSRGGNMQKGMFQWGPQNERPVSLYRSNPVLSALTTFEDVIRRLYHGKARERTSLLPKDVDGTNSSRVEDKTITWGDLLQVLISQGWVIGEASGSEFGLGIDDIKTIALKMGLNLDQTHDGEDRKGSTDFDDSEGMVSLMGSELILSEFAIALGACALRYSGDLGPNVRPLTKDRLLEIEKQVRSGELEQGEQPIDSKMDSGPDQNTKPSEGNTSLDGTSADADAGPDGDCKQWDKEEGRRISDVDKDGLSDPDRQVNQFDDSLSKSESKSHWSEDVRRVIFAFMIRITNGRPAEESDLEVLEATCSNGGQCKASTEASPAGLLF